MTLGQLRALMLFWMSVATSGCRGPHDEAQSRDSARQAMASEDVRARQHPNSTTPSSAPASPEADGGLLSFADRVVVTNCAWEGKAEHGSRTAQFTMTNTSNSNIYYFGAVPHCATQVQASDSWVDVNGPGLICGTGVTWVALHPGESLTVRCLVFTSRVKFGHIFRFGLELKFSKGEAKSEFVWTEPLDILGS
jgi:hypothetical protein